MLARRLGLLVDHARERYALTVIDCGTLAHQADQIALTNATHVAWVLPATAGAVARGQDVLAALDSDPLAASCSSRATSHPTKGDHARAQDARARTPCHADPVPSLPELATGDTRAAIETAQVPLQAILGALSRP